MDNSPYNVAMSKFIRLADMPGHWDKSKIPDIKTKAQELAQAIKNTNDNIWPDGRTDKQQTIDTLRGRIIAL